MQYKFVKKKVKIFATLFDYEFYRFEFMCKFCLWTLLYIYILCFSFLGDHSMKQVLSSFSRATPSYKPQPKVSCVTVFDSDSDDHLSPLKNSSGCKTKVIKPEPQKDACR